MFILVSMGNYLNTLDIRFVIAYNGSTVSKNYYKSASEQGKLVNFTRGRAVKSLVVLNDGTVVAIPIKAATVIKKINDNDKTDSDTEFQNAYYFEPDDDYSD